MKTKNSILKLLIFLLFITTGLSYSGIKSKKFQDDLVGKTAPEFSLKSIDGKEVKLSSFKGKVVILDFWATWCPPCRAEIPGFIELQKTYGKKGLVVLGVALDDLDKVKKFYKTNKMNYPVVIGTSATAQLYGGIEGIPTTFILDADQKVIKQYVGRVEKEEFEKVISRILPTGKTKK